MHILLVADGRSPITRRWVAMLRGLEHTITLVSSFPCAPLDGVSELVVMPLAFASWASQPTAGRPTAARLTAVETGSQTAANPKRLVSAFRAPFLSARYLLGPLTLAWYGPRFRRLAQRLQPDVVHALRIPFEGMLAASTPDGLPLAVSIWGNDLTLHAHGSPAMAALTRRALGRADALLADAARDLRLARAWGFDSRKPQRVLPGSGGLDLDELARVRQYAASGGYEPSLEGLPPNAPLVLNPRGFRTGSVRSDTFFQAIPLVLERKPETAFACAAMAGQPEALRWVERLKLADKVTLLPLLPQAHLWRLFLRAAVSVSVSQHDGTPNSLLEAMALGCFPIVGDIESLREWITPGVNGLLVPPDSPQALAEAILLALDNPTLRAAAAQENASRIAARASLPSVAPQVASLLAELCHAPEAA